jgi:hypothetical protein
LLCSEEISSKSIGGQRIYAKHSFLHSGNALRIGSGCAKVHTQKEAIHPRFSWDDRQHRLEGYATLLLRARIG